MSKPVAGSASSPPPWPLPYKRSMDSLLQYVGLSHYGDMERAHMPLRSITEQQAIDTHYAAAATAHAQHVESLKKRGLYHEKQLKRSVEDAMDACVRAAAQSRGSSSTVSPETRCRPTVYMSFEESLEWKAFLLSLPPSHRHVATVKRTLSIAFWTAHQKRLCIYCWLPKPMCVCDDIDKFAVQLTQAWQLASSTCRSSAVVPESKRSFSAVRATMLLHPEEVLRGTNTGHVVGAIMNATVLVWGVPEHDTYIRSLTPFSSAQNTQNAALPSGGWHNVVLYPATGAPTFKDFVHQHVATLMPFIASDASGEERSKPAEVEAAGQMTREDSGFQERDSSSTSAAGNGKPGRIDGALPPSGVHLILLDSTWSQALSLNRHIPRVVPRVALVIDPSYESLFGALRKRTRSSGVSTLEATSMALHQCLEALGHPAAAIASTQCLTAAMQSYVNLKCILKCAEVPFARTTNKEESPEPLKMGTDDALNPMADAPNPHRSAEEPPSLDSLEQLRRKRDGARRADDLNRYFRTQQRAHCETGARRDLLLPPVLNYCYLCDRVIGWHRMPEHVQGQGHRRLLKSKMVDFEHNRGHLDSAGLPAGLAEESSFRIIPSAFSRTVVVENCERPWRRNQKQ